MDVFFQYCTHENEEVSKQSLQCLNEYVKYHLDIFFADGKNWSGLGPQPQEKAIEKILSFDNEKKRRLFNVIKSLCRDILSPTITGTSSTYKTVTFSSAAISPTGEVKNVRRQALEILKELYSFASTPKEKRSVLGAMDEASRTPTQTEYSDEVLSMILDDTVIVLEFIKGIVANENLEVVQSIEHDIYYL